MVFKRESFDVIGGITQTTVWFAEGMGSVAANGFPKYEKSEQVVFDTPLEMDFTVKI